MNLTEEQFNLIFANPLYCVEKVHEVFTIPHEALISEELWISAAKVNIQEIGIEQFLKNLLGNLKNPMMPVIFNGTPTSLSEKR